MSKESQNTINGNINNYFYNTDYFPVRDNQHSKILGLFEENVLRVKGHFSKDIFASLCFYVSDMRNSDYKGKFAVFLKPREIFFEKWMLSVNFGKFFVFWSFLRHLDYVSGFSNICVVSGVASTIYNCLDGKIIVIKSDKCDYKVTIKISSDIDINGVFIYAYGRANKIDNKTIEFHIHDNYIVCMPCTYGNQAQNNTINLPNVLMNDQIMTLHGSGHNRVETNIIPSKVVKMSIFHRLKSFVGI